jgi:hypothetical protein
MSGIHSDILGTVGNTPVVKLNKLAPEAQWVTPKRFRSPHGR